MFKNKLMDILYFGYPLNSDAKLPFAEFEHQQSPVNINQLKDLFLYECEMLLQGEQEVILPLSGGLDSRLILGLLLEILPASKIHAFNYGTHGQLDFEISPLIAKKAGINFAQVNYNELSIDCELFDELCFDIDNTPSHNLIGFNVTKIASERALEKLTVDDSLSVWSGFLGDRVFTGMWSDSTLDLKGACNLYVDSYGLVPRNYFPNDYSPESRMFQMYRDKPLSEKMNFSELMEYQQRQSRVKNGLKVLDNRYHCIFAQSNIISALLSMSAEDRVNGQLQKDFCLSFYPDLFALPVTSNFGYPLRKYSVQNSIDRAIRLSLAKIDKVLNTQLGRFKRKKMTTDVLKGLISGYESVLTEGAMRTSDKLKRNDIDMGEGFKSSFEGVRTTEELYASIGFLKD